MKVLLVVLFAFVAFLASPVASFAQEGEEVPSYHLDLWIAGHAEYEEVNLLGKVVEAEGGEFSTKEAAVEVFQEVFKRVYDACRTKTGFQGVSNWNHLDRGGFSIDGKISADCLNVVSELGGTVTTSGFSADLIDQLKPFAVEPGQQFREGYYNRLLIVDSETGPVGVITAANLVPNPEWDCFQGSLFHIGWEGDPRNLFILNQMDSYGKRGEGFGFLLAKYSAGGAFEVSPEVPDYCSKMISVEKPAWLDARWQNDGLILNAGELAVTIHTSAEACTEYDEEVFEGGSIVEVVQDDTATPVAAISHATLIAIEAEEGKIYVRAEAPGVVTYYTHEKTWSNWTEVAAIYFALNCEGGGPCGLKGDAENYLTEESSGAVVIQTVRYFKQQ